MVEDLHLVGFIASGPGFGEPKALRFIHLKISSAVIAVRRSCKMMQNDSVFVVFLSI
jgi:hypothetical protein